MKINIDASVFDLRFNDPNKELYTQDEPLVAEFIQQLLDVSCWLGIPPLSGLRKVFDAFSWDHYTVNDITKKVFKVNPYDVENKELYNKIWGVIMEGSPKEIEDLVVKFLGKKPFMYFIVGSIAGLVVVEFTNKDNRYVLGSDNVLREYHPRQRK